MRFALLLLLVISVSVGCTLRNNQAVPPPEEHYGPQGQNVQNVQNDKRVEVKQTIPPKRSIKNAEQVSRRLEMLAKRNPMVKDATCVVFGNTAIIGINVEGNLDRARVGTIKYSVAEALRKDPYGVHAIVTADLDLAQRIREIRKEIDKGRPIAGFAEELADIIGRIVPQLPRAVRPGTANNPPAEVDDSNKVKRGDL